MKRVSKAVESYFKRKEISPRYAGARGASAFSGMCRGTLGKLAREGIVKSHLVFPNGNKMRGMRLFDLRDLERFITENGGPA